MHKYLLTQHVYTCVCDNRVVLLDLRKDRYLALDASGEQALRRLVPGWPLSGHRHATAEQVHADAAAIEKLLEAGLVTSTPELGKDATPVTLELPTRELVEEDPETSPRIRAHHIGNFLLSWVCAAQLFRRQPLERIITRVRRRNERGGTDHRHVDLAAASTLVGAFDFLRPLIFTARDACLFHSLTLIEFLSRYGIFPMWVFGVRAGPFAAHCWVQHGDIVFNDTAEHARLYTPIMTA